MTMRLLVLTGATAVALSLSALAALHRAPALDGGLDERHAVAVRLFREQRYAAAYGRFARLADNGHAPSAQVALLMADQGRTLFGGDWAASAAQRRTWRALAAQPRPPQPADEGGD